MPNWSHNKIYAIVPFLVVGILAAMALFLYNIFILQQDQLKISKEQHILNVYSSYKNNIDSCISLAKQAQKDNQFIQANCIDVINSSLVGTALKDWGRSDLLVTTVPGV